MANEFKEDDTELESLEDLIKAADEEFGDEGEDDEFNEEDEDTSGNNPDENEGDDEDDDSEDESTGDEDGDEDENDSDGDEGEGSKDEELPAFKTIKTEVNGIPIEITSEAELQSFIKRGAESFNKKKDELEDYRDLIKQGKVSSDDIRLLIDAKNGDAKAIAKLAQVGKIDLIDVDSDSANDYKSQFQTTVVTDVEKVAQTILDNKVLHDKFINVSSKLPQSFIQAVTSNSNDLKTFAEHLDNGLAYQIIPEAVKLSFSGMDFNQAYVQVGRRLMSEAQNNSQANAQVADTKAKERVISDREKELRNKAREQKGGGQGSNKAVGEDEIWNMSQEEFENYTKSKSKNK